MATEFIEKALGSRPAAWRSRRALTPPNKETAAALDKLERMVGGPLPLALRAWYEQVGSVSLVGWHSSLSPNPDEPASLSDGTPEPLVIWPIEVPLTMAAEEQKFSRRKLKNFRLMAGAPGIDRYGIRLPSKYADDIFDQDRGRTFLDYLRRVFAWGGFPIPGKQRPGEKVAQLKEGLLPL